jgi:ATP-binding cassette subfamily B protein RaxB
VGELIDLDELHLGFGRRLPVILQTEAAECGLACLTMIAGHYGYRTDLSTMRSRHAISLKGATLTELIRIAGAIALECRPLRLELDELAALKLPCILHWNLNHFVVLKRVRHKTSGIEIDIHDPARGEVTLKQSQISDQFTGVALELSPTLNFQRREERQPINLRSIFGRIVGLKRSLTQVLILAIALELFGLVAPFLSQWIIDDALVSGDIDLLTVLVAGVLLVSLIKIAIGLIRSWVIMHLSTTLSIQWYSNVFRHLLRLPMPWFEKRHLGDVVSRFGSINAVQGSLTSGVIGAILDGLMAVITLGMMAVYSLQLTLIVITAVFLYAVLRVVRYDALRNSSAEQLVLSAKQQSYFMESVRGVQSLKLFNRQEDRRQRYIAMTVDTTNNALSVQKQNMVFSSVNSLLVAIENAAVLYFGAKLVVANAFSVGMLIAFISYKDQFVSRVSTFIDQMINFKMLGLQAERLADIVLTPPEDLEKSAVAPSSLNQSFVAPLSLEVRNVSFRYAQGEPWILRNISLRVEAGESVAIAGPSGCGKTTLLKVMLGQLSPEEGEVLVNGIPITRLGLTRYRELIGVVMQDDQLFAGSLADNISFFDPANDQQAIEKAARLAAIHGDIVQMPMSYLTLVGDMGTNLSGGQRQRLVIARAIYKMPRLLFLDEATSHLDTTTESKVNVSIRSLPATKITIAHRPQTLEMADRVVTLQKAH